MAAAYAAGIIHNHPFVDDNKRMGFMSAHLFLAPKRLRTTATEVDVVGGVVTLLAANGIEDCLCRFGCETTGR